MINQTVQKALNEQIQKEFASAYLYLSMAAHFEHENLPGLAHWMKGQAKEEMGHGMRIFEYINERGGQVVLGAIEKPDADFGSPAEVFQQTLEHERKVTASINALYELAVKEKDYPTQIHLQWFINEQVEEENTAETILEKIKALDETGMHPLLIMDAQLGKREG
ncbi:MAG: ferritin [Planctomycetota bacterium]|nr:MAG: ferritin [Planctomycetota bacterium]